MDSLAIVRQEDLEKENSEFKPVLLCLKIDFVSHSAHRRGLGEYKGILKNS